MWAAQAKGGLDFVRAGARDDFALAKLSPSRPRDLESVLLIAVSRNL